MLMDLAVSGKLDKAPREAFSRSIDGTDSLHEELWLVCYEAGIRGWGVFTDARILGDYYFQQLHDLGINFYDCSATSRLLFNVKPGTLRKLNLTDFKDFFERDDADDYLEYKAGDGGYEGVIFDEDQEDVEEGDGEEDDQIDEGEVYYA